MIHRVNDSGRAWKHPVRRMLTAVLCLCILAATWVPAAGKGAEGQLSIHLPAVELCAESPSGLKTT